MFGTATDIDDRRRAEQAARFLADASATLAALVDEASTLQQVARLAVPHFADWCVVDMAGEDGEPRRLAVAHVDPAKVALAHDVHRRYPPNREASTGVFAILHSGKPELVPEVTDEMLAASARDEDHLQIIRKLGLRSYIGVPLPGRDGTLGVISFVASDSGRHYGPDDLRLAQDLANRAAVAVENARLYEKMKEADRRKDEFLATLAHELRNPLAPIRNALQLMARSSGVDHEAERAMAERLVTHLARLVDDLMDVARISRGRIELRKEVVELAPIVARVVQTVGPSASARRHDLAVSLPEQPVLLDADPTPAGADPVELAEQRHQVHRAGRANLADGPATERRPCTPRPRHGHRHPGQDASARLRDVLHAPSRHPITDRGEWALAWDWSRTWWNCTAARLRPIAMARAGAASSSSGCRSSRTPWRR